MDARRLARWRMRVQRLTGTGFSSAPHALQGLLAVQAENYSQATWAVAARTRGLTQADFTEAFAEGAVLRTHVLRPT